MHSLDGTTGKKTFDCSWWLICIVESVDHWLKPSTDARGSAAYVARG